MKTVIKGILGSAALAVVATGASASTLEEVRSKGYVQCGVHTGLIGFAAPNDDGEFEGFDVDVCRAVAAAIFGDGDAVQYTPTNATERFTALQSGEIDMLSRNTTWTLSRDTSLGFNFAGVNYYDGQGFMINSANLEGINSALQLSGAAICVQTGTTTELNLADYFRANNMEYNPVVFQGFDETNAAYEAGRCDAYTTDQSGLIALRLTLANPDDHVVLPEIISKEPLGPAVRQGDDEWFNVVRWTLMAMVQAEESGITQDNLEEMMASDNPEIRRILGQEADSSIGAGLGLDNEWVVNIVREVGNYGEVFDRHLAPIGVPRGLNALWTDGGLMYAMPLR
ncbi:transporter substrate-binding domain-containing protein [Chelativorans sp. ZYF759]|uniref:amino acid ABC transporter substrate-binding protein n=1 Tax=Chelativorans sp. ZYF759 TaxID=2692213 RepID=UPI00145F1F25|nr:amino acid ABC transporter substrate-binding protein [Chelativorans sp. ZYF759]NMG39780.1 transporter substrate-binding domain-containing protein [Chelativorans sp. ZYF759]